MWNLSGEVEQHGEGKFSRRNRIAARSIHYHHASLRCRFDVHIVHADSRAANDPELRRRFDYRPRDFRLGADHQSDGVLDHRQQLRLRKPLGQHQHFEFWTLLQQGDAFLRHRITHQHFHKERGV